MINIDDIQESMAHSEGVLFQALSTKMMGGELGSLFGKSEHVYSFLEKSQDKVLPLLYAYYSEHSKVGVKTKRQVFEQIVGQESRHGAFSRHLSPLLNKTSPQGNNTPSTSEFTQWEKKYAQLRLENPKLYDELRRGKMQIEHSTQVLNSLRQRQLSNALPSQEKFDGYVEKILGDVLTKCRQYEEKIANACDLTHQPSSSQRVSQSTKRSP